MIFVTDAIRVAAARLLSSPPRNPHTRKLLERIAAGHRQRINADWWVKVHGTVTAAKLDKLERLADPGRNSNEHERAVAAAKLQQLNVRRAPGLPPEPPPLSPRATFEEMILRRAAAMAEPRAWRAAS